MPKPSRVQDINRLAHSYLFTARLWWEDLGVGRAEWRGKVQHVTSDEVRYFRNWPGLVVCIQDPLGGSLKEA